MRPGSCWAVRQARVHAHAAVAAERGALYALEGSCRTAIGAYAILDGQHLTMIVEALTPDGVRRFRREGEVMLDGSDDTAAARELGLSLGLAVKTEGGDALILAD